MLADLQELVGFFSYSREDDEDSMDWFDCSEGPHRGRSLPGPNSAAPETVSALWQDKKAIAPGKLWEREIRSAIAEAVFFIPIVSPTTLNSPHCKTEFQLFLEREREMGRSDLIFPILYIQAPQLEKGASIPKDSLASLIAARQSVDWRDLQHHDVESEKVKAKVSHLCVKIAEALRQPYAIDNAGTLPEAVHVDTASAAPGALVVSASSFAAAQRSKAESLHPETGAIAATGVDQGGQFWRRSLCALKKVKWLALALAAISAALLSLTIGPIPTPETAASVKWVQLPSGSYLENDTTQPVLTFKLPDRQSDHSITIEPRTTYGDGEDYALLRGSYRREIWLKLQVWHSAEFAYVPDKDVKTVTPNR